MQLAPSLPVVRTGGPNILADRPGQDAEKIERARPGWGRFSVVQTGPTRPKSRPAQLWLLLLDKTSEQPPKLFFLGNVTTEKRVNFLVEARTTEKPRYATESFFLANKKTLPLQPHKENHTAG